MPRKAEREDGRARFLNFWFFVLSATAKQAAPCAKFAEEAIGIQVFLPVLSIRASTVLYIW